MHPGDIVTLGRHRLMCGDAANPEHVDALMDGERPDMLYCDPPYGMALDTRWSRMGSNRPFKGMTYGNDYAPVAGDDSPFEPQAILALFADCPEQFWWGADYYAERIPQRTAGSWIVWDKRVTESMSRRFGSCFELCWSRKRHKRQVIRLLWTGFFGIEQEPERKRLHPTQKPIALAEWFLERYSKPDALVADLYAGSGSTLLACERTSRRCATMELSPAYCDLIVHRYESLTGKSATLAA